MKIFTATTILFGFLFLPSLAYSQNSCARLKDIAAERAVSLYDLKDEIKQIQSDANNAKDKGEKRRLKSELANLNANYDGIVQKLEDSGRQIGIECNE